MAVEQTRLDSSTKHMQSGEKVHYVYFAACTRGAINMASTPWPLVLWHFQVYGPVDVNNRKFTLLLCHNYPVLRHIKRNWVNSVECAEVVVKAAPRLTPITCYIIIEQSEM